MNFRILPAATCGLLVVCNLFVTHIKNVQSSFGDSCTQNDTNNCTFPGLKCTPAGRCDCYLGLIKDGPSENDTICNTRYLSVPLISTTVTSTSVTFHWEGSSPEKSVNYSLEWTPLDGRVEYINSGAGQVSGLLSDRHYNFTIVSDLSTEVFHPGGKFFGEIISICTAPLYAGKCSTCGTCQDPQLGCVEAMDKNYRCLCRDTFFNLTDTGNCTSLQALVVTNITSTSTPTEITLHWTATTELSYVTYTVDWSPYGGELGGINETGATVSALTPGVSYHFSISSVVPSDAYSNVKIITSQEYTTSTQYPYLSECVVGLSEMCQDTTKCVLAMDGLFHCLCGPTEYFNDNSGLCCSLEDLTVTDVSKTTTAYTATFTWKPKYKLYSLVNYTLEWTPSGGRLDNISSTGAHVSGLTTSTLYNFTIISVLPSDEFYSEKNVSVQISPVMTENDLEVTTVTTEVTATSVTFTWTGSSLMSVDYVIQWTPGDGRKDFVNSSGCHISGLRPDNLYTFTIVSQLFCESPIPERVFLGPNVTICTGSLYGGNCSTCHTCESDRQSCTESLDKTERCLCNESFFNLTHAGDCTSLEELVVGRITTSASTTAVDISWMARLQLSSVKYLINLDHSAGQVDNITNTGARVSVLSPGRQYYFSVESVVAGDSYNSEKIVSSQLVSFWTDALYLGMCYPSAQRECQEMTECALANDAYYYCMCDDGFYFNQIKQECSTMDDLKVTGASTTTTATTVLFTWPAKTLPALGNYTVTWSPEGGTLDSVGETGAHISGLNSSTSYNFTITTYLPADHFYPERRVSVQISFVMMKSSFNETCDVEVGCQDYQHCLPISGSHRCLCYSSDEYYDATSERCLSTNDLEVSILSTTITATTVTFHWIEDGSGSGVDYNLEWIPKDGYLDYVHSNGGQVSGLLPNSLYNFSISGESADLSTSYYGPNVTICTKSLYGGECLTCGTCQDDHQSCTKSLDNSTRCLCQDSYFNLTENGNCTSLSKLIVTNITTSRSTTSVNITWAANLLVSAETYRIMIIPKQGHVDSVSSTGGQVLNLFSNAYYYFSVESDLPGSSYESGKSVSSPEMGFYTDVDYLGYCDLDTNKECQEKTQCDWSQDNVFRCICESELYFNNSTYKCSNLDDLKVANISATTTATTVALTWPDKQLPATGRFKLEWVPKGGTLDNISSTGAHLSKLATGTLYNLTITSLLPSDEYYPERSVSVHVSFVFTKSLFGEQCNGVGTCLDDDQKCSLALDNQTRCLCGDSFFNLTLTGNCTSLNELIVTNITFEASTTSVSVSWTPGLQLSYVTYQVQMHPPEGHVDFVTSTGGRVSGLSDGDFLLFSVESDLPGNRFENGKSVSSPEIAFWTDVPYLGYCDQDTTKECQERTECIQSDDGFSRCLCGIAFYFNITMEVCLSLDDLKVTDVTKTTTATTVTFTWPAKQLPDNGSFHLEWAPEGGHLDRVGNTGAHVSGLTTGKVYSFEIMSVLPADKYYPEKRVSVEISSVTIKNDYAVTLLSTSVLATTVTLLWQEGSSEPGVDYNIEWTPKEGQIDYINSSGVRISGLLPDSQYNLTIESELPGESLYPEIVYVGPNLTVCTKSLYGKQCSTCGSCQDDHQNCVTAFDKENRCLCDVYSFNFTETGNCTSLNELLVSNINITSLTTSVIITWSTCLHVTSEVYRIQLNPMEGQVDNVTNTGGQVSALSPGTMYSLLIQSVLLQNEYVYEKMISSSEITFWTDVFYLGLCAPYSNKQCLDKTECVQAMDDNYRCLCDPASYFNTTLDICSSLDNLKVTNISATTTATTVALTWPDRKLPATGRFKLEWVPKGGTLDNISSTGAHMSGLSRATLYNLTIIFLLPSDEYYPERSVSVQITSLMTTGEQNVTDVSSTTTAFSTKAGEQNVTDVSSTTTAFSTKVNEHNVTHVLSTATVSSTKETLRPESSEHSQGLGVADQIGIGLGCVAFIIIVVAAVVVICKRRVRMSSRLEEISDHGSMDDGNNIESILEAIPSDEDPQHSSSTRHGHRRRSVQKQVEKFVLGNILPNSQDSQEDDNKEEVTDDSFDNRDTKGLFGVDS